MKKFFLLLFLFLLLTNYSSLNAQSSFASTDPKVVVEKFLDMYFKGEWFEAAKTCGTEDCSTQIEIMMRKMAMDDVTDESGKCKFTIDSVKIDIGQKTGRVFFTKICTGNNKPVINQVEVVKQENEWFVEYLFKRDRYF
jgi:hypothetical protein